MTDSDELQFVAPSYRQVLNSEGLTAFVNGSYSWGRPGTEALRVLDYKTRSTIVEAGVYQPIIRSRERNLTLTGLAFISDNYSFTNLDRDRAVPGRPAARRAAARRRRRRRQPQRH